MLAWVLFLVATVFNLVVMFNLLIAIISETFAKVNENAEAFTYQVMTSIIAENHYLIPDYRREEHCAKDKYLLFARNLAQDEEDNSTDEKLSELMRAVEEQKQKTE